MARASGRLDMYLVPHDPDEPAAWGARLWAAGVAAGWWGDDGAPGADAGLVVPGGFRGAALRQEERPFLVANGLGGFRVACPACGRGAADTWHRALRAWQGGGERRWCCGVCGVASDLNELDYAPPIALVRSAVQLVDVATAEVELAAVTALVGPLRAVGRRTG
jgi:hypothetical protein